MLFDFNDWILIYKLRKNKKLFYMPELKEYFKDSDFFAFGTGGSVENIDGFEKLKNKNTLFLTTGPIHCYKKYGFVPNMWIVTNPPSMEKSIIEMQNIDIDFSNTFIFLPSPFSNSKEVKFSSDVIKKFRKIINNKAIFVFYEKDWGNGVVTENYLSDKYPIENVRGSAVEGTFISFLYFLGVKNIFFSGIDMIETGHFWDRKECYQDINGKKLNFEDIKSNEEVFKAGKLARQIAKDKNLGIYRLEKEETILLDYEYKEFKDAYNMSSDKIYIRR